LGLRPLPFAGSFEQIHAAHIPILGAFSPLVVPREPDWGDHVRLTGWWYPEEPHWSPPAALQAFLEDGDPPVFIGFGSMPVRDPTRLTALIVDAAHRSGRRVLLHAGWAGLGGMLPPEAHAIEYAPYGWLFPRMAAVIHHGGSGTTGFALRSGVPSMFVPFLFDQHYWGARTERLGAGLRPIPLGRLTAPRLAEAIRRMTGDIDLQKSAAALGRRLAVEDGVADAIHFIESRAG
jgi:sterol 3beta-glucosyltransferase